SRAKRHCPRPLGMARIRRAYRRDRDTLRAGSRGRAALCPGLRCRRAQPGVYAALRRLDRRDRSAREAVEGTKIWPIADPVWRSHYYRRARHGVEYLTCLFWWGVSPLFIFFSLSYLFFSPLQTLP